MTVFQSGIFFERGQKLKNACFQPKLWEPHCSLPCTHIGLNTRFSQTLRQFFLPHILWNTCPQPCPQKTSGGQINEDFFWDTCPLPMPVALGSTPLRFLNPIQQQQNVLQSMVDGCDATICFLHRFFLHLSIFRHWERTVCKGVYTVQRHSWASCETDTQTHVCMSQLSITVKNICCDL